MRVLLHEEQVLEVISIIGHPEAYGGYTVYFSFADGEGMQFEYKGISAEEAENRAKKIIKEAFEKGCVDVSNEPWDII